MGSMALNLAVTGSMDRRPSAEALSFESRVSA